MAFMVLRQDPSGQFKQSRRKAQIINRMAGGIKSGFTYQRHDLNRVCWICEIAIKLETQKVFQLSKQLKEGNNWKYICIASHKRRKGRGII